MGALAGFGPRVDARQLFERDRATMLGLVQDLAPEEWERPTAAAPWLVRDVVAHLLGDDLSRLARTRDGHSPVGPQPDEPLAAFIHRFNDEWVQAARRVSPRLLIDLLDLTSPQVLALWRDVDLDAITEPVTWAGPEPAPGWLDCARDFTEYWIHQQQIRDATGRPEDSDPAVVHLVLDTFLRAMPQTLAGQDRPEGTTLTVVVTGAGGGRWCWRRRGGEWLPVEEADGSTRLTFPTPRRCGGCALDSSSPAKPGVASRSSATRRSRTLHSKSSRSSADRGFPSATASEGAGAPGRCSPGAQGPAAAPPAWATLAGVPPVAVTLRPAVPAEADALSRLALRSKGHWGYDEEFLTACRVELTLQPERCDGVHTVVAERGDALLGFYRLAGEAPVAELADLFVDPMAIGRGVGATLLADAVDRARALGVSRLVIDADPNAAGFYVRMGARRVGSVASSSIVGRELPRFELVLDPAGG